MNKVECEACFVLGEKMCPPNSVLAHNLLVEEFDALLVAFPYGSVFALIAMEPLVAP